MKLKPIKKKLVVEAPKEEVKKERKSITGNKLPSDNYKPLFEPKRYLVREFYDKNMQKVKRYIEFSVKRFGEDEENAPEVYLQMYQESAFYTGYIKGKCVHFPLEELYSVIEYLEELSSTCDEKHIY